MRKFVLRDRGIKRIHVHRANIARNIKDGGTRPQWIVQTSKGPISCHKITADHLDGSGPTDPQLSCGARVYLTTRGHVTVFINEWAGRDWLTTRAKELIDASL
jgi:hypothetical protein